MAIDKLERQLALLAELLHTDRHLRASEIQERVEGYPAEHVAFRRSFERDKEDLRRLGIPIEIERTETIDGGVDGYRVSRNEYYLHDLGLEPDEVVALSVALRLIKLEGDSGDDALWKLGGASVPPGPSGAELAAISIGPAVTVLHEAIADRSVVEFDYRGVSRRVEPWRLAFRKGQWYVNGYDVERSDSRTFRLDRIEGTVRVDEPGTAATTRPGPAQDRQPWQFTTDDEQSHTARVAIDAKHARWARHHLQDASVVAEHADGAVELELAVTNVAGFRSMMLTMTDGAEILSPPELRDDMIAWLEAMVVR